MEYNRILKPEKFDNFTIVPTYIFRHKDVSVGATGLYCWLFSHRSDQTITVEFMINHFKESKSGVRSKLNELIELGYVKRIRVHEKGRFKGYNYKLLQKPKKQKAEIQKSEKQKAEIVPQSNINNIYNNINKSNTNVQNENIKNAYPHFVQLFPEKYHPKNKTQIVNWMECIDKCVRIDGYDLKELYLVVKYMRDDEFWSKRFMTLLKLRNQDKNGIKYVDRFFDDYKNFNKPKCYWKIKNIVKYVLYNDPDGSERLGAVTKTTKLNEFNLSQRLNKLEIEELKNHIR